MDQSPIHVFNEIDGSATCVCNLFFNSMRSHWKAIVKFDGVTDG